MAITFEATYENGVLRPAQALPLNEHEKVQVTVHTKTDWVQETAGMIKWGGDAETLQRFAEDVELDPQEAIPHWHVLVEVRCGDGDPADVRHARIILERRYTNAKPAVERGDARVFRVTTTDAVQHTGAHVRLREQMRYRGYRGRSQRSRCHD